MTKYKMRACEKDLTGYYYERWDRAAPIDVCADSADDAYEKARAALPKLVSGWGYKFAIDKIEVCDADVA